MMARTTSFFTGSSYSLPCHRTPFLTSPPLYKIPSHFKKGVWGQRFLLVNVKCESEGSTSTFQSESETTSPSSLESSSFSAVIDEDDRSISAYKWCAAVGGIGFLETAYVTTSMAVASGCFLYILSTKFVGETCLYCLASAALSISLLFINLKSFGLDKIQKMLGSQLCIASLVVIALTTSYDAVQPVSSSLAMTEMPYVETEITKESSPLALSLARHLRSIGAKLYGAFWCSHCVDQKQMFGREAAELLDYVECFPDGVREGTTMAKACFDVKLKGFPAWEINGQVVSGEKQFSELARLSGIKLEDLSQ